MGIQGRGFDVKLNHIEVRDTPSELFKLVKCIIHFWTHQFYNLQFTDDI